jgi:hypothetical protein
MTCNHDFFFFANLMSIISIFPKKKLWLIFYINWLSVLTHISDSWNLTGRIWGFLFWFCINWQSPLHLTSCNIKLKASAFGSWRRMTTWLIEWSNICIHDINDDVIMKECRKVLRNVWSQKARIVFSSCIKYPETNFRLPKQSVWFLLTWMCLLD